MRLLTKVTNSATNQRYLISTVGLWGAWQTAVFKWHLGPFSGFWPPQLVLNALEATQASAHHDRVAIIVRDVHPTDWERAKLEFLGEDAHARAHPAQTPDVTSSPSRLRSLPFKVVR